MLIGPNNEISVTGVSKMVMAINVTVNQIKIIVMLPKFWHRKNNG